MSTIMTTSPKLYRKALLAHAGGLAFGLVYAYVSGGDIDTVLHLSVGAVVGIATVAFLQSLQKANP